MNVQHRLNQLYESAPRIPFDNRSRLVLFSDCHRGDGSAADNFSKNQNLYFHAVTHYFNEGFTYLELGDGDELWENKHLSDIVEIYSHIYWMISRFYKENRLHMLYGNHDIEKRDPKKLNCLKNCYDERKGCEVALCPEQRFFEALVLRHRVSGEEILLIHGHQVDFLNYDLWRLARFLVRYLWKPLETFVAKDPTSAAKNYKKRDTVERHLISWTKAHSRMLVAGHTHRPVFPSAEEPPYYNTGSCVHPRCITCIEIDRGQILLVKWTYRTRKDGTVYVGREVLEGPRRLSGV